MPATIAQTRALAHLGFTPSSDLEPAIQCSSNPLETYACADWDSLVSHATNYQLCDCGRHGGSPLVRCHCGFNYEAADMLDALLTGHKHMEAAIARGEFCEPHVVQSRVSAVAI